jgi:hypothetical protein
VGGSEDPSEGDLGVLGHPPHGVDRSLEQQQDDLVIDDEQPAQVADTAAGDRDGRGPDPPTEVVQVRLAGTVPEALGDEMSHARTV